MSNQPGTQNQRFVFVHPYKDDYYPEGGKAISYVDENFGTGDKELLWPTYKYHFYLPFRFDIDLCYQAYYKDQPRFTWTGNANLKCTKGACHQISAEICNATEPRQMFIPVFA